jgi:hypothetical protein
MVFQRKDFRRMRGAEPDRAKPNRAGQEQAELAGAAAETARAMPCFQRGIAGIITP